jgi:4-carboxymuconolactone decarboxylase
MIRDELFETGIALRRTMFGVQGADDQIDNVTDLDDKLQEFVTRQCFGDIWQRDVLDPKSRSLVTIAMLVALGRSHEIGIHMRGGLANGLTVEEIREVLLQSIMYCGLPAAVEGFRTLRSIVAEGADEPAS